MIHSGQPAKEFIDSATRHVLLRQGVLGIKVKIMRGSDPEGKSDPRSRYQIPLPSSNQKKNSQWFNLCRKTTVQRLWRHNRQHRMRGHKKVRRKLLRQRAVMNLPRSRTKQFKQ